MPPELVLLPSLVPAQRLRLGLLGPADRRADHRRGHAAPGPSAAVPPRPNCAPASRRRRRKTGLIAPRLHRPRQACSRSTTARRSSRAARPRSTGRPSGSSPGRRPTAAGAASSRRWVYSILALHLLGYPLDHPVVAAAIEGIDGLPDPRADRRRADPPAGGVPVAGLGHLPRRHRAARRRAAAPDDPAVERASEWLLDEEIRVKGDWAVRAPGPRARRLGVRVRQRLLPRHRRHRRGRAGAAPGRRDVRAGRRRPPSSAACAWTLGMQSRDGGWAAFDADNTRAARREAAVLRLRRGHRPADAPTSPRTSSRCSRTAGSPTPSRPAAACSGCSTPRRPTAPGSGGGAPTTSTAPAPSCPALVAAGRRRGLGAGAPGGRAGWSSTRTPTAAGARTCAPTSTTSWRGRGDVDRVADRLGAAGAARGRRAHRGRRARRPVAGRHAACRRRVGRGPVHRHRLSRRLLHQLRDVPAACSRSALSADTSGRCR